MHNKHELKWELVNFSEIDKYAIKSYCNVHGVSEDLNLGDVASIKEEDMPNDIDLVTYAFPCQDLSASGKLNGFIDKEGNKTRSGLFFDAFNFINKVKPKIAIAENVKNLTSKRFADEFNTVLSMLEEAGYNNYWKVLNAKDYGVPQNRERVFIISIRKDIDNGKFKFPDPVGLDSCLLDELENEVDDKYYLSEEQINRFVHNDKNTKHGGGIKILGTTKNPSAKGTNSRSLVYSPEGIIGTLCATDYKQPKQILQVGQLYPNSGNPQAGRVYDPEGISPTLNTCGGGNGQVKILIKEATKKGYTEAEVGDGISLERPGSKTRRGRIGKGVSSTLTTSCNQGVITDITGGETSD